MLKVDCTRIAEKTFGQDVAGDDAKMAEPDGPRAFHIVFVLTARTCPRVTRNENRHCRYADGDHRIGEAGTEEGGQARSEDQERRSEQASVMREMIWSIQTAEIAGDETRRDRDHDGDQH